ncbi:hypothetical protein HanIR_Chr04g0178921 [Helianthus annuus]|nr:hypothetical protein HanIR_Chr04g0178921 [Helianthus annuus]
MLDTSPDPRLCLKLLLLLQKQLLLLLLLILGVDGVNLKWQFLTTTRLLHCGIRWRLRYLGNMKNNIRIHKMVFLNNR